MGCEGLAPRRLDGRKRPAAVTLPFCCKSQISLDATQFYIRRCCLTSLGAGFLWVVFVLKIPWETEDNQGVMAIRGHAAALLSLWNSACGGGGCGQVYSQNTCTFQQRVGGSKEELWYGPGWTHWSPRKLHFPPCLFK